MSEVKVYPPPKMVERKCKCCCKSFQARAADVKRGWGLFCSKSCKAIKQEQKTHQHRDYTRGYWDRQEAFEKGHVEPTFSNAHQFSNEEHDCNKD
ncbi:hypothetical protein J2801_003622 [Paraburkholderia phenoliruptrix]|uniref:hypothetical protein n=1 Tax=Paraburkholderia phenoliruptrix TaxID=252970 RepID=UPI0028591A3D|nr:hypothetical protein [Paraburkholderia phenoliruptrix]MDR6421334.1 hypothetical protein [Paraburkholderia phenoliruptrix]